MPRRAAANAVLAAARLHHTIATGTHAAGVLGGLVPGGRLDRAER
jgi:hypothetical protein